MKQMLLIVIIQLSSLFCYAQTSIGLDLASLLYKELNAKVEHKISEHWSMAATAGINLKSLKRNISDEEFEHNLSFHSNALPTQRPFIHREHLSVHYWANSVFSGTFVSVGGEYRTDTGLDARIGVGYMFPIWKGLIGSVIYDIGIMHSSKTDNLLGEDFKIELSWIF